MDEEPQSPASPSIPASPIKGKFDPKIIAAIIFALIIIVLAIGIGFGMMRNDPGEPSPYSSSGGSVTCNDWTAAQPGYQDSITRAANKVGISPALLGALFLSENGDAWTQHDMNSGWNNSGAAKGPFQLENWENKWKTVTQNGYGSGTGNYDLLYDGALAAAAYIANSFKSDDIPLGTTEEKHAIYAALAYNCGPNMAHKWAQAGYDLNTPVVNDQYPDRPWGTNDYAHRLLNHFNTLNTGCTSGTINGVMPGVVAVPGLHQCAFGNANICDSGCSQTSLAMLARYFGNKNATPMDVKATGQSVSSYVKNNNYFKEAEHFKTLPGEPFPAEKVSEHLSKNQPILFRFKTYKENGKTGHNRGHYVVIVGISSDKKNIYVEDPFGWIPTFQPKENGNPPLSHSTNPDNYGLTSDGLKFEFWAVQSK